MGVDSGVRYAKVYSTAAGLWRLTHQQGQDTWLEVNDSIYDRAGGQGVRAHWRRISREHFWRHRGFLFSTALSGRGDSISVGDGSINTRRDGTSSDAKRRVGVPWAPRVQGAREDFDEHGQPIAASPGKTCPHGRNHAYTTVACWNESCYNAHVNVCIVRSDTEP